MTCFAFTGSPCSGKTTTANELCLRYGYYLIPEAAALLLDEANGDISEIRKTESRFSELTFAKRLELEAGAPEDQVVIVDRGIPDSLAYFRLSAMPIPALLENNLRGRYRAVFLYAPLPFVYGNMRNDFDLANQSKIGEATRQAYAELDYPIIDVPVMPIEARAFFVQQHILQLLSSPTARL